MDPRICLKWTLSYRKLVKSKPRRIYLTNTDESLRHGTIERVWETVHLGGDGVDQVCLERHTLEEHIAIRSIAVGLDIELREIRLERE